MLQPSTGKGRFLVITGLSGSGKSTVLRALEDIGYYAVDNLPVQLFKPLLTLKSSDGPNLVALGMDVRAPGFLDHFPPLVEEMSAAGLGLEILFLEANEETLIRRFSETRRQHPLARSGQASLAELISRERAGLSRLREMAQTVVDTSKLTVHTLKRQVWSMYEPESQGGPFRVNLVSFGFKHGLPVEADLVLDVRFLPNPYFIQELRDMDGHQESVVDFALNNPTAEEFLQKSYDLLKFLLPCYQSEGRSRVTIAIGCTGGRHRSVAVVENTAKKLQTHGYPVTMRHRDIDTR